MIHCSRQLFLSTREVREDHECQMMLTVSQEPKKSRINAVV
jgi:hypothetical protein